MSYTIILTCYEPGAWCSHSSCGVILWSETIWKVSIDYPNPQTARFDFDSSGAGYRSKGKAKISRGKRYKRSLSVLILEITVETIFISGQGIIFFRMLKRKHWMGISLQTSLIYPLAFRKFVFRGAQVYFADNEKTSQYIGKK